MYRRITRRKVSCGRRRPCRWMPRELTWWVVRIGRAEVVLQSAARKGITARSLSRDGVVSSLWTGELWWGDAMAKKRVPRAPGAEIPQHLAAVESNVLSALLPLVLHCSETRYDDGSARQPGWWTVKTMGSAWVVEVKDPDTCSRLVVIQQTIDDAMTLASVLLESEDAPWEPDPWMRASAAKKKTK